MRQATGLLPETVYYYRVRYQDDDGSWSDWSAASASFTTGALPVVEITAPGDGQTYFEGASIAFEATATDGDDGDVSDAIVWSSSVDGSLGSGALIGVVLSGTNASPVTHTITATAFDSGQEEGSDTIEVTVGTSGTGLVLGDDVQQELLQTGVAATVRVALKSPLTGATLTTNPLAAGDVKKSVDGAAAVVLADDANAGSWTVVNGFVNIPLSAAEVTGDEITLKIHDESGSTFLDKEVKITVVDFDPRAQPADAAAVDSELADDFAALDALIDAIKAKTDSLTFTVANQVDVNLQSINDESLTGDGSTTPFDVA